MNHVINTDCFEIMTTLETGSIDLICSDLPYGTMKDIGNDDGRYSQGMLGKFDWDVAIDLDLWFKESLRLLREGGRLILFGQQPFTTELISRSSYELAFSYNMIWKKTHHANSFQAKRAPLNYFEDIVVFTKRYDCELINPLREYFKKLLIHIGLKKIELIALVGQKVDHTFRYDSMQFKICTEETYNELIERFSIDKWSDFLSYRALLLINSKYLQTFNLWEGNKFKSNVLEYPRDVTKYHPTQKPVALLEDLIQTFTNPGDQVADFTMGSGSCGVAAKKQGRDFIGVDSDETYYEAARHRLKVND